MNQDQFSVHLDNSHSNICSADAGAAIKVARSCDLQRAAWADLAAFQFEFIDPKCQQQHPVHKHMVSAAAAAPALQSDKDTRLRVLSATSAAIHARGPSLAMFWPY